MKRLMSVLMTAMFLAATPFVVSAQTMDNVNVVAQDNISWTEVEKEEVPEAVNEAVKQNQADATIKKIEVGHKDGQKIYKVTLKDSADKEITAKYKSDGTKFEHKKKE